MTARSNSDRVLHGPQFSSDDWNGFETGTKDYLGLILGRGGVPLSYVIRDNADRPVIAPGSSRNNKIYWNAPLFGTTFNADNLCVWTYLLHRCSDTPGWIWIQQYRATNNGREVWFALSHNHGVMAIVPANEPSYEDGNDVYIIHRDFTYHDIYDRWRCAMRGRHPPMMIDRMDLEMGLI